MTSEFYQRWIAAKEAELLAIKHRRAIEDEMLEHLDLGTGEGTHTFKAGAFKVKITQRMNRRVDPDILQELANENGMEDVIPGLFRFRPEVNLPAWKAADPDICRALAPAITTTPGRASFSITVENK